MNPESTSKSTKICPTCGTRVSEDANRCLVCGTSLVELDTSSRSARAVQGSRMPQITLNLPIALGLLVIFISIGAALVFFGLRQTGRVVEPTQTPTVTLTVTPTITPTPVTPTPTDTPLPTPTPISYIVKSGETCISIAYNFGVSVQSIVLLNNLSSDCTLYPEMQLLIPQPTPTATPLPTSTLSPAEATEQACEKATYTVQQGDTLSTIANAYNIPMAVIREYNGLPSETVFEGMTLTIPLCQRYPTPGPSPTATLPPPYSSPNLLLPAHGSDLGAESSVALQWASVGAMLENERYMVIVVDISSEELNKLVDYVSDTKYLVPASFRPAGSVTHAFEWWVTPVRQAGTDEDGNPVWEPAGSASERRVFLWSGSGQAPSPTP